MMTDEFILFFFAPYGIIAKNLDGYQGNLLLVGIKYDKESELTNVW